MINAINNSSVNNVIPQASSRRRPSETAFGSEKSADSFESPKRESFLYRYRGIFGFIAGALAGEMVCAKFIRPRIKNLTTAKDMLISLPAQLFLGLAGQATVENVTRKKNN